MAVVQGVESSASLQGPVSDRTAHVCVRCAGQFTLALESVGEVNLDCACKRRRVHCVRPFFCVELTDD